MALTPILLVGAAMVLSLNGHKSEAIVAAIAAVVTAGPKLVSAIKGNGSGDGADEED